MLRNRIHQLHLNYPICVGHYKYSGVIYSSDKNGIIGCGIFDVNKDVRNYITNQIYTLSELC